ncbi:MAG: GTPase Era, partial [Bradyrhizobium sp.]
MDKSPDDAAPVATRCGFVALIGAPNVGKSTTPSPDSAETMKVSAKARRSLAALASASSFSRGTRSILFRT